MGLNIKNAEAIRLAHELADVTGETVTRAVTESVRERLERLRRNEPTSLAERLLAIGRDCSTRLPEPARSADHAEMLYGDDGLPH